MAKQHSILWGVICGHLLVASTCQTFEMQMSIVEYSTFCYLNSCCIIPIIVAPVVPLIYGMRRLRFFALKKELAPPLRILLRLIS